MRPRTLVAFLGGLIVAVFVGLVPSEWIGRLRDWAGSRRAGSRPTMSLVRWSVAVLALSAVLGCAAAAPSASPVTTPSASPTSVPTPTTPAGLGLCAAFTPDLAVAALRGPVDEPTTEVRGTEISCHYAAAGGGDRLVEAYLQATTRADCEDTAAFLGITTPPIAGVGEVAYHMDRSHMGDRDAFVLAWAKGQCVRVFIKSDGDQAALLRSADAIAARILQ